MKPGFLEPPSAPTDMQDLLSEPGHDAVVKSTARAGTRRMVPELRAMIPPAIPRADQELMLEDPRILQQLIEQAYLMFNTAKGVVVRPIQTVLVPAGPSLRPARRIGTYQGAMHRVAYHPHRRDNVMMTLPVESLLELAWVRRLEYAPSVTWMQTQPFVMVWPWKGRCIWRIPDVLYLQGNGWHVMDVKPDELFEKSAYLRTMFALAEVTLRQAQMGYSVAGSLSRAHMRALTTIHGFRWLSRELDGYVADARDCRRATVGGVVDSAGRGPVGWSVLFHLLTQELAADFEHPLHLAAPVRWDG